MTTNFDELGHIILPPDVIRQFDLTPPSNLMITLDEPHTRIVLFPTQESMPHFETGREIYEYQAPMLRLPTSQWRYIRRMDIKNRVVLPRTMRHVLGWTEDTELHIFTNGTAIYVEQVKS